MINKQVKLTKCNFCRYWTGSSCCVVPNSAYCKEALDEYYQYLRRSKLPKQKSLRSWDRR